MIFSTDKLRTLLDADGISYDDVALGRFKTYAEYLVSENEKMNLTAITEPEEIAVKHFFDCSLLFKYVNFPESCTVADVGSGAGFPGLVLKILRPDIKITLFDSLGKRVDFLKRVADLLSLDVNAVHIRAEDAGNDGEYRENFDIVTARAVARMSVLSEYCLPLVRLGGKFCALKGSAGKDEAKDSLNAVKILGGAPPQVSQYSLLGDGRTVIICEKISQTPSKYPRMQSKISKKPL